MLRKMGAVLFAMGLVMALAVPAQAAQTGEIAVTIDSGLTDVMGRQLMLIRVGEQTEGGYRITEEFGGGLVLFQDAFSPHLAKMLCGTDPSAGQFRLVDADNTAFFSGVEPGLYLLRESGSDPMILPHMTAIPQGGQWAVQAYPAVRYYTPENPRTGQHPAPILGALGMVLSGIGLAICAGVKRKK